MLSMCSVMNRCPAFPVSCVYVRTESDQRIDECCMPVFCSDMKCSTALLAIVVDRSTGFQQLLDDIPSSTPSCTVNGEIPVPCTDGVVRAILQKKLNNWSCLFQILDEVQRSSSSVVL